MNAVQQADQALLIIIGVSAVLLLAITAVMVGFVVRYRRSRHPVPADIRGNWKLEVMWTLIPTVIALAMFAVGWKSYVGLRTAPEGALEFEVLAQQFSWIFVYPNKAEGVNELVVPHGQAIKLKITSLDVVHGLFLPAFRIKVDAVAGLDTHAWFMADRLGEFDIQCTEYCGTGHSAMLGKLRIVPEAEYQAWIDSHAK